MSFTEIFDYVKTIIFEEAIGVVFGFFIIGGIVKLYTWIFFGRWEAIVIKNGKEVVCRPISASKRREMVNEKSEKSVFIKGIASPYGYINCDILEECKEIGVFDEDGKNRKMIFNFDKQKKNIESSGDIFYLDIDFQKQSVKLKNEDEKPKEF